jgi:uncharacterized Zn finger protein
VRGFAAEENCVTGVEQTVSQLIARFALRRNANYVEFMAGVWLVQQGAVYVRALSARALRAAVRDGTTQTVSIVADGENLVGGCSCGSGRDEVCRHQVAAVHAVWLQQSDSP